MYTLVVLLTTFIGIQAISDKALVQEEWNLFKLEHGKFYDTIIEENYRKDIFMANSLRVNEHNKLYAQGLSSYALSMNQFADLQNKEFLDLYTTQMPELPQNENLTALEYWSAFNDNLPQSTDNFFIVAPSVRPEDIPDLPGDMDWRTKDVVTPVKDQGNCGSCWSFSATGALEAQWRLHKSKELISLSEQNLVDCSGKYGNFGCKGGWMHWAFNYIKANGGIDSEDNYKYTAQDGQCKYDSKKKAATVSQVVLVPPGEKQLEVKVGTIGPMSVAVEVSGNFHLYGHDVYDEPKCGHTLNHAMLAVGYGTLNGHDYWLVKNSWGKTWGKEGYILMSRNKNNQCGIALKASYPIV